MIDLLLIPVALIYLLVILSLFIYGMNLFYLTFLANRREPDRQNHPSLDAYPKVTIQLPIYNEMYVVERLIRTTAAINYPKELLEIQILDDSTDETTKIIENVVSEVAKLGINILHYHRQHRRGFKAGALADGFERAQGEFIAIFDADFLPPANFLEKTLPQFADPRVGFVQTRWGHTNTRYSLMTLIQALSIDAHFVVEQYSRSSGGYWFNFNGSAGIWRRTTVEDAGGWKDDTLSEDLDLSYRAYLHGWRGAYLRDVVSPAELPVSMSAFRRQQHRWARGSLECALRYLPKVWDSQIPRNHKFQATIHLLGYAVHLLLVALVLLHPLMLIISLRYEGLTSLFGIGILFNLAIFAQYTFILSAQHKLGNRWWRFLPILVVFAAGGTGMMVNTLRAAIEIFTKKNPVFERTPKYGLSDLKQKWTQRNYQLKVDPIVGLEIVFALVNAGTFLFAAYTRDWIIATYSILFSSGLFLIAGITLSQAIAIANQHKKRGERVSDRLIPGSN